MIKIHKLKEVKIVYFIVVVYTLLLFSQMLYKHYLVIQHPYQLEYRETANIIDTKAILAGDNPYCLKNLPYIGTCYGIGYSAVCAPFAKIFGLNAFSHRLVSILSILLTCILFFGMLRKEKIDTWLSLAGAVILYFNLTFNCQAIARPDALGMLFFTISVLTPIYYKYSPKSLLIAILFSILAFYVKQYYILGLGIIIVYLFLFVSMKKAMKYGVVYGVSFILSVFLISYYFETYFYSTLLAMQVNNGYDGNYAINQFLLFFSSHFALMFMLIISSVIYCITNSTRLKSFLSQFNFLENSQNYLNLKSISKGILMIKMNVYVFLFLVIGFLLLVKLGGNLGAFLTYHYQLLTFSFIMIVLKFSVIYPNSKQIFVPVIFISLYLSYSVNKTVYLNDDDINNWRKISRIIKKSKDVLNTPAISYELLKQNRKIYATGLNAGGWSTYKCERNTFPGQIVAKTKQYIDEIQAKIINKKFDVLILDAGAKSTNSDWYASDSLIELYYEKIDSTSLRMFQTNQVWIVNILRPKK